MAIPFQKALPSIYLGLIFFVSCKTVEEKREAAIAEHIGFFKENEGSWNNLAKRLIKKFDTVTTPGIKNIKEIGQPLRKELRDKGIEGIWPRLVGECREFEIYTDWTRAPEGRIRLTWSSCPNQKSGNTFYRDWDTGIRIEKITDNWYLWMVY